jgi:hypothetical protein
MTILNRLLSLLWVMKFTKRLVNVEVDEAELFERLLASQNQAVETRGQT